MVSKLRIIGGTCFGVVSLVVTLTWLIKLILLKNSLPFPSLVAIESAAMHVSNATKDHVLANFDIAFAINNPSKTGITYSKIEAFISRQDNSLSYNTTIAPFDQDGRNSTTVWAKFSDLLIPLDDRNDTVMYDDNGHEISRIVRLDVLFDAKIKKIRSHWSPNWMEVDCKGFEVALTEKNHFNQTLKVNVGSSYCLKPDWFIKVLVTCEFWGIFYLFDFLFVVTLMLILLDCKVPPNNNLIKHVVPPNNNLVKPEVPPNNFIVGPRRSNKLCFPLPC